MPDIIPPSAPVAPQTSAPVAHSGGMKDFISQMGKKPEPKPVVSDAPPKESVAAAPVVPATTPADDHPDVPDVIWDKAPKNLKNAYYKTRRELESKLTANETRLKELESKPNQSPSDLKHIKELEERITRQEKDLEERNKLLTESSYERSDEFKKEHVEKWERTAKRIGADVSRLRVKIVDEAGNETERSANGNDIDELRDLNPYAQDRKIKEMFGDSAYRVQGYINELDALDRSRKEAVANANVKSEEARRNFEKQNTEYSTEFKTHGDRMNDELVKAHPVYFAPDPTNPEATAALERGLKYVDECALNQSKMSPKDKAETATMIRYLAGAAPRLMTELKQVREQLAAKDEELAKYRKSSPGSAPSPSGSNAAKAPEPEKRGVAAMIESMKASVKR